MANEIGVDIVLNGDEALRTLKAIEAGIDKFAREASSDVKKVDNTFSVFKGTLGSILAVNFADFLKDQVADSIRAFKEFETGLTNVAKTTDLSAAELKQFELGIEGLAKTLPVASKELLDIATAAGQLGVKGTKNLLNFTETIAKLGRASDVTGDEAATALTRILNVTGESTDNIDELASVVVALGNNFAATESEIIRVANEVARATQIFGVSSAEASALGATLRSFGIRAEEAGSAVGKTFRAIELAVGQGGRSLQELSKITGLTGAELQKQFGENALGVFQKFLVGLNEAEKSGKNLSVELKRLGLEGETIQKVIPTLSSNYTELSRAIELANAETKNATALNQEFARFAQTTESQTQLLANAFEKLQRNIGEKFGGAIKAVTPALADFISRVGEDNTDAFARSETSVVKLRKEIEIYQNKLRQITADGKVSFFEEDPEEVARRISVLNARIQELNGNAATDQLKALEDQLKALDAQAKLPINLNFNPPEVGAGVLLPDPKDLEAQRTEILAKITNLRNQIALENNQLVEDNKATQDKLAESDRSGLQNRVDILAEFRAAQKEQEIAEKEAEKALKQVEADADIQFLIDNLGRENTERELARIKQIEDEKRRNEELKKLNDKARAEERAGIFAQRKWEDLTAKEKVAVTKDTLAQIATLTQSSNSALFALGKAAALTNAGINTAEAVTKAYTSLPYPFNLAGAAAVGAAGAVQIARIASSKPPSAGSFADGGIVDGPSQSGDRLTANVNAGEVIFNRRQQENLFNAVNSGELGGGGGITVNIQGDFLSSDQSVDKLIDSINDAIEFRNRRLRA